MGTKAAKRWLRRGNRDAELNGRKFAKIPALNAYFASLVNLGCFVTEGELPESEEEGAEVSFTWEDIELSPLGLQLAKCYDTAVSCLPAVCALGEGKRGCAVDMLT